MLVNMDAIDGGRGRAASRGDGRAGGGNAQGSVEFGEPYRGPAGAVLRFPPERPPQSQLMVDPDQLRDDRQDRRQASRDAQPADPTPARKPAQRQRPDQQPSTAPAMAERPDSQPDAPARRQAPEPAAEPEPTQSQATPPAEVPDSPDFRDGGAPDGAARTDQPEPDTAQADTAQPDSEDGSAPTDLTARPSRKPTPPQATSSQETRTAARQEAPEDQQSGETAAEPEPASDTTASDTPESTQTAASQATEPDTAGSDPQTTQTSNQTQPTNQSETATPTEAQNQTPTETAEAGSAGGAATETGDSGQTQTASLPPEGLPEQMRLMFADGSASLSDGAKQELDRLAQVLEDNPRQRVQLMAFAEGTEDTASQARRLSLSRALAVRTYLIDQGIRSTRMDVRALGATADQGPLDRVDIVPASR